MSDGNDWQVRRAGVGDAKALALVGAATFLETFAGLLDGPSIVAHCAENHSPEFYERILRDGGSAWLAEARVGSAPIGFALLAKVDLPGAQDGDIELKRIYTLSRYFGTGVGGELMRQVVASLDSKYARLLLGVFAGNDRALAFYGKQGFERIADRRFDVGGTLYDDIVLARPLA